MHIKLSPHEKKQIANTCERILELEEFQVNMETFIKRNVDNECKTSYCIAGRLATLETISKQFEYQEEDGFNYINYSFDIIGTSEREPHSVSIWEWLFSQNWPNNLEHAKKRAEILLKYIDVIDERFNFDTETWDGDILEDHIEEVELSIFSKYDKDIDHVGYKTN